jgi:hypothetical protein
MSWDKIAPSKPGAGMPAVSISGTIRKDGASRLTIGITGALSEKLKWGKADRVDAYWGKDEHASELKIVLATDGAFKLARLKASATLHIPGREGCPATKRPKEAMNFRIEVGGALIVFPPNWALVPETAGRPAPSPALPPPRAPSPKSEQTKFDQEVKRLVGQKATIETMMAYTKRSREDVRASLKRQGLA